MYSFAPPTHHERGVRARRAVRVRPDRQTTRSAAAAAHVRVGGGAELAVGLGPESRARVDASQHGRRSSTRRSHEDIHREEGEDKGDRSRRSRLGPAGVAQGRRRRGAGAAARRLMRRPDGRRLGAESEDRTTWERPGNRGE